MATEGKFFWLIPWRGCKVQITMLDLPVCSGVSVQRALPAGGGQALGDQYFFMVMKV